MRPSDPLVKWRVVSLALAIGASGCTGMIADPGAEPGGEATGRPSAGGSFVGVTGLRRLSTREYDATVRDLLGEVTRPSAGILPEDVLTPFDNDATTQSASAALVEAAESLATESARALVADPARRVRVTGCEPTGPTDTACFRAFVARFGRLAFRRPLDDAQLARYATASELSIEAGDFWAGVAVVIAAMLQDPRFLYRIEIGTPVSGQPGLHALDGHEIATRLSYFLWGTTPDEALLARAAEGGLDEPHEIRTAAAEMLRDLRARDQIDRFHAFWLGYEKLPHDPELAGAMRIEVRGMIDRVVFDEHRPWHDLFRLEETFVNDTLATHYGLPAPGSVEPTWVSLAGSGRRGILSTGAFLALGAKHGDTSPTQRGREIRARLLCHDIGDPPPGVNTDEPPPETASAVCKWDRFAVHRTGGCASCHQLMDPIGFGLERYDALGRYRTHDEGHPECAIAGEGELYGIGTFAGPTGLSDLLVERGLVAECMQQQLYRFALGHHRLDENDRRFLARFAETDGAGEFRLDELILAFVSSEAFRFRREVE